MPKHRVLLDCDPGRDDALAIAMLLASAAEIELVGIAAVGRQRAAGADLPQREIHLHTCAAFRGWRCTRAPTSRWRGSR